MQTAVPALTEPPSHPAVLRPALTPTELWWMTRATVNAWLDDRASTMGAALAYYTLFSMAPLLLVVVSVAGLIWGPEAARGEVFAQLAGLMGSAGAAAVQGVLESVNQPESGLLASALGIVVVLIGATTVLAELQGALDVIWRVPPAPSSGWFQWVHTRLLSFGMLLGLGFLLAVSLLLNAAIAAVQHLWTGLGSRTAGWLDALALFNHVSGFALMALLFAMIYKWLPRRRIAWSDVWLGAVTTAALLQVGRIGIGTYINTLGLASGFGAAGALVAVLAWVYYSAQIFLLGAEFTSVYAYRHGSLAATTAPARLPAPAPARLP